MVIRRGEIWWATLPQPRGSEPGFRRPVIVVQSNGFNRSQIATVIIVVVTSNLRLAQAPGNVFLPRSVTNLSRDSVANVSQVMTVDKRFLVERIGLVPSQLIEQVEDGLRLILSL